MADEAPGYNAPVAVGVAEEAKPEEQTNSFVDSLKSDWLELSGEVWGKKFYILKAALVIGAFAALQFAYQYFVLIPGEFYGSLLRGLALSGATLVGLALCIGPLAYLKPEWNFVEYRRTVGVSGFMLAYSHAFIVIIYYFSGNLGQVFYDLNPFRNPIVFGSLASMFFLPLFLTSTDWAVSKLGFRNWKTLHRLIYPGFVLAVLHFTQINPALLYNPAGYLLLAVTAAAMILQLAGFAKKIQSGKAGLGLYVGAAFTLVAAALLATAFFFKKAVTG